MNDSIVSADRQVRTRMIFSTRYDALAAKTDRLFGYLFIFQWLLGIAFALVVSPKTWLGESSQVHIHVYAAVFLGGLIAGYPVFLVFSNPGAVFNRMVISVSQIFFSVLLIHLSGGRIETHFHVFGSLAFLAFYRDWRTVAIATTITALDHLLRGAFWPESVYGVLTATPWRAFEHAAWVIFEDIILIYSIILARAELWTVSESQARLEEKKDEITRLNQSLEKKVEERTKMLMESKQQILDQQQALIASSKMSALGEMAGGVAHEINTPLAVIGMRVEQMEECVADGDTDPIDLIDGLQTIRKTVDRIAKIVSGLRFFAREGRRAAPQKTKCSFVISETLGFCQERFANHGVQLDLVQSEAFANAEIECRSVEISQVLLNLLNNAFDAIQSFDQKWIKIEVNEISDRIEISVTDSGQGIPQEIHEKLMQPFFTTKEIGKGTGLGLSISRGIVEEHKGRLFLDTTSPNTRFVISLPRVSVISANPEKAA